ncbi:hypothetical protein FCH79_03635 [Pseudomonas koreensis]|jgi:hypothetical protein|uniref:Uncharacterized protein n=2 Tax=Pseudomonas TaxID=286 RepID=A0A5C4L0I1_PSEJE|nr:MULTISPECIES: hypothetical protein [Pseudomonas]AVX90772.1 hypothetical protein PkP19E3_21750 [Pseudomonas koreensis]EUB86364.1 hypothetical protein PMI25_000277 [Pseudomonas sp. GM30]KAA8741500.1 hypothetical protein FE275_09490 [Pseudomonas koreensis]MBB6156136.1 hypothetical protein [Pseudomonas sp. JAI115]MBY8958095.1 hypothetical protein [Pseudomonas sp. MIS38]
MARKEFEHFEAVSAVVPVELGGNKGYHAAIAVKALVDGGAPRFHKLLGDQVFPGAIAADEAAINELDRLKGVTDDAELIW